MAGLDDKGTYSRPGRNTKVPVEPTFGQPGEDGQDFDLTRPPSVDDLVGATLKGKYQIKRKIAAGGMGVVYEGFDVQFPAKPVAIKIILPELSKNDEIQKRFRGEAETLMDLQDPGLVNYRDFDFDEGIGSYFIVMEFVKGSTLAKKLGESRPSLEDLKNLTRRLAHALKTAHQYGVFHRDMSPENVLLAGDNLDQAKIIDFGIAKKTASGSETYYTTDGGFKGKLGYAAPEQFGDEPIGSWTDVYSLALVILAVAMGKKPPMGKNQREAVLARQTVPELSALPKELRPLLRRMLEPDPDKRLQSMDRVIAELDARRAGRSWLPAVAAAVFVIAGAFEAANYWPDIEAMIWPTGPLTLQSRLPENGAANVPAGTNISLTFSGRIAPGTGEIVIHRATGGNPVALMPVTDRGQVSFSGSVLTINPRADLPGGGRFYVTIPEGAVVGASGQRFAGLTGPSDLQFTTAFEPWEAVERRIASVVAGVPCSWLTVQFDPRGYPFSGNAPRAAVTGVASETASIAGILHDAAGLDEELRIEADTTSVWPVLPQACASLDMLRGFREPATLPSSLSVPLRIAGPQRAVQVEVPVTLTIGEPAPQNNFALVRMLPDGRSSILVRDRADVEAALDSSNSPTSRIKNKGGYTYEIPWLLPVEAPRNFLFLLRGNGPFDLGLTDTFAAPPAGWQGRVSRSAADNGWSVAMAMYEVTGTAGGRR